MPVSPDPAQLVAPADLFTLLQALPSCRMRRGVRYPQWFLLVAILAILSGQGSLVGMERFAKHLWLCSTRFLALRSVGHRLIPRSVTFSCSSMCMCSRPCGSRV